LEFIIYKLVGNPYDLLDLYNIIKYHASLGLGNIAEQGKFPDSEAVYWAEKTDFQPQ